MARRQKITGVIEAVNRTGKSFKLDDGEWYGAYKPQDLNGAQVGDEVEFDLEPRESGGTTFYNVKGGVTILGEGPANPPAQRSSGGGDRAPARGRGQAPARGGREAPQERTARAPAGRGEAAQGGGGSANAQARERSIQRQVALKAAVEFYAEAADATVEGVIQAAEVFAGFLEG